MQAFIRGIGSISPQKSIMNDQFLNEPANYCGEHLSCIEPNYKEYINPKLTRRMSRVIKMAVTSAKMCLNEAATDQPDAIITGTGLGCLQDTIRFMNNILDNDEKLLNPAPFIQSTHNTISGQIALILACTKYNSTYVHRSFSFESALLDGMMQLNAGEAEKVLIGGIDELTPESFIITKRLGYWKKEDCDNLRLLQSDTAGSYAGEGAAYFLITKEEHNDNYAAVSAPMLVHKPDNEEELLEKLVQYLATQSLGLKDIDLIMLGTNGDNRFDASYTALTEKMPDTINSVYYKHLCGEYHTSSAYALSICANIIKSQTVPEILKQSDFTCNNLNHILYYNQSKNADHSFFLISKC